MSRASHSLIPVSYRESADADQTGRFDLIEKPGQVARNRVSVAAQRARDAANEVCRAVARFHARMERHEEDWEKRPKRALIVDDNHGMRVALRAVLDDMFDTIDEAEDVLAAHALAREHYYDIIIVDVRLRAIEDIDDDTGVGLVSRIRQKSHHPMVPILMISGRTPGDDQGKLTGDELMRWSDRSGANDYFEKQVDAPNDFMLKTFNREDLRDRVRELMAEARPRTRLRKR